MRTGLFFLLLAILGSCTSGNKTYEASGTFQLAPPILSVDSMLFKNSATLSLHFGFPDSQIRYTLDGKDVDSNSPIYTAPIVVTQAATLKAKAYHPDFRASDPVTLHVEKLTHDISQATVTLTPLPHDNYKGSGAQGLVDMQKGGLHFRGNDAWLGFQANPITITIAFKKALELSTITLSCLQNQGGWIFGPQKIEVLSGPETLGETFIENVGEPQENRMAMLAVPIKKGTYAQLTLQVYPMNEIPQWHQGKGSAPWLFIDEILVE